MQVFKEITGLMRSASTAAMGNWIDLMALGLAGVPTGCSDPSIIISCVLGHVSQE